jgi:hypothetical protein
MVARAGTVTKVETGVDDIDFAPGTSRPNGAFMALLEALIREIALALSLPYGFVYNMASFGGVTARLETQSAQRVFCWYQEMLEHILLNRVKHKVLLMAIAAKKLPMHKNWDQGSWRYGATLTGDVGHQVQADLDLVRTGAKTRSQIAAEYNNDFAEVMEKTGAEIVTAIEVSKRLGVPLELLIRDLENPTQLIATLERAKTGEPDPAAGPPPPPGLIGTIGDKGVKNLLDLVMAVNRGEMDRASAINTAMAAFAMDPLDAQTLFPMPAKVDALGGDEPAPVAAKPAAKKPKPDTVK